jgi:Lipocalin-like domain
MNLFGRRVLIVAWLLVCTAATYAADLSVLGAWKLVSFAQVDAVTAETSRPWGENPSGYLIYLPDGHMSAVLTSEGRKPVSPTEDKYNEKVGQLLFNMAAYAGTYTVKSDTVVHHVEVAWQPAWVGSDQPRQAKINGDMLTIRTQPIRNGVDGKEYVYVLIFRRAQ